MTDIREKVARTIWEAQHKSGVWDAFKSWATGSNAECEPGTIGHRAPIDRFVEARADYERLLTVADAALAACGHQELVKALEEIADHFADTMRNLETHGKEGVDNIPTIKAARAALAKARGTP